MEEKMKLNGNVTEKEINPMPGIVMMLLLIILEVISVVIVLAGVVFGPLSVVAGIILFCVFFVCFFGLKVVNPNEALVLTLFGKYYGTIKKAGFHYVNPFVTAFNPGAEKIVTRDANGNAYVRTVGSKKVSTKVCTLNNEK